MNFAMDTQTITDLDDRGRLAAEKLQEFDIDTHRWARYLSAMSLLEEAILDIDQAAKDAEVGSSLTELSHPDFEHKYKKPTKQWATRNQKALSDLLTLAEELHQDAPYAEQQPRPAPALRVAPRL